jgi:diguanylate cyclase (GGDEF)-like protein
MDSLTEQLPADSVGDILRRAGETRTVEELSSFSAWSSYDQFKRLLQQSKITLGSNRGAQPDNPEPIAIAIAITSPELIDSMQALGSPSDLLATGTGTSAYVPIRRYEATQIESNEWTISERFIDGFAPYQEFCEFAANQYQLIPLFYGIPRADVVEEECQVRGDPACLFRVRWQEIDETTSRAEYLEVRNRLLEARLEQLQDMVTDLASNERYEDVLQGIVASSMQAAGAGDALMVLNSRPGSPRKVYFEGLTDTDAASLADGLLEPGGHGGRAHVVQVVSARRHYGVLAIGEHGGLFGAQTTLETYGRLAAAALDAADALEAARHQANSAQVLLELSTSLSTIASTEEMAAKVARAVLDIIGCDRAAIFLNNERGQVEGEAGFGLVACYGYPDAAAALLGTRRYYEAPPDSDSSNGIVRAASPEFGTVASVSAPITVAGETIGWVVAGVIDDPDRLTLTQRLADRLNGLAAQASIAICNARLVDQIRFQAMHDALTGLPNRALILDRTDQMLSRARRTYAPVAALFIDLDGFKDINDTLGHGVGDQLLQAVTARLAATMRESDSVGRLGGDEFVVLVDGSTMDAGPELVAERLLDVLREPFTIDGTPSGPLKVTASIGIASGTRSSATELLRDADIALYKAKAAGKDCFVVFQTEMHAAVQDRHLLEMDLRDALRRNQYFLVYQPIFNLRSGETIGVEALLRWRHPERGVVQPDVFIPILESSGMIIDVGRWVLDEACRQGARWHALGYRLDVSVNVSARQLETDRLNEDIRCALEVTGFDARSLIVEITETAIMKSLSDVVGRLTALKTLGVRIAIDDFGTGYSSLAYLQQFPVDTLKIDRSFIAGMADSPESSALIHTLVQLGKTLGLETLAEGIEESEQRSQLEREQCDSGQGYLYARPMEADSVETFLGSRLTTPDPHQTEPNPAVASSP